MPRQQQEVQSEAASEEQVVSTYGVALQKAVIGSLQDRIEELQTINNHIAKDINDIVTGTYEGRYTFTQLHYFKDRYDTKLNEAEDQLTNELKVVEQEDPDLTAQMLAEQASMLQYWNDQKALEAQQGSRGQEEPDEAIELAIQASLRDQGADEQTVSQDSSVIFGESGDVELPDLDSTDGEDSSVDVSVEFDTSSVISNDGSEDQFLAEDPSVSEGTTVLASGSKKSPAKKVSFLSQLKDLSTRKNRKDPSGSGLTKASKERKRRSLWGRKGRKGGFQSLS